jgi:hypothetical protein
MANTWRATAQGVAYASGKDMLDIFNGAAATRVLRAYRGYWFNNGTTAVTGVLTEGRVNRITASSAGTSVTPVAHDTNNSALEAAATAGTGRTVTVSSLFRKFLYSNDEPAVAGSGIDEWELLVPFAEVWNAGYGDSNIQPVTCRVNQGFELHHQGTSAVGSADLEIEFTDAAS